MDEFAGICIKEVRFFVPNWIDGKEIIAAMQRGEPDSYYERIEGYIRGGYIKANESSE